MTPETHHAYPIPAPWASALLQNPHSAYRYGIWYAKNDVNMLYFHLEDDPNPTVKPEHYAYLGDIAAGDLEGVFMAMQGELWSPNGEARDLLRSLGLHHTSMSVGDIVADYHNNTFRIVMPMGFAPVTFQG